MDDAWKNQTSGQSVTRLGDIIQGKPRVIDSNNLQDVSQGKNKGLFK